MEDNQYTTTKVQPKDFVSGWVMAFVIAGTGLTLPMFFLGSEIALSVGFKNALWAFGMSTFILTLLCVVTTLIGNRSRLSTYMILHFSFGEHGAKIINVIMGFTLLGWFSFALELLATAIKDTAIEVFAVNIPHSLTIILVSFFITFTTIYGIKRIEKLNNITVPIVTLFFCFVLYKSLSGVDFITSIWNYTPEIPKLSLFEATSILVGSSILFPVLMADFSRFIRNDKQSLIAVLGISIGFPVALIFSAIPSIQTGEVDIMQVMSKLNLTLPAFFLLFVSTWAANSSNLYSTVLTFSTIKRSWNFKTMTMIFGAVGTLMALLEFSNYLFDFLNLLGVLTPSISSIYIINFFWVKKQQYNLEEIPKWGVHALVSWVLSSIITAFTYFEVFQITHAFFLDSFILGGIFYLIMKRKSVFYRGK